MRTLVFLVHGMGMRSAQPNGNVTADQAMRSWYTSVVATLRSLPGKYGLNMKFDMDDRPGVDVAAVGADPLNSSETAKRLTVVPITYCDILGTELSRLTNTSTNLGTALQQAGTALDKSVAEFLDGKDATDAGFVWTHVVDVLLLHLDAQTRTKVRLSTAKQITDAQMHYAKTDGDLPRMAFITHSLGTFATADAIQAVIENSAAEGLESFSPGILVIDAFFTLANVSRLLSGAANDPYSWFLRPRTVAAPGVVKGVVRTFFNAQHEEDPFMWAWPFNTPLWDPVFDYNHAQLTAMREVNVHGFSHYLSDPRTHCDLLNILNIGGKQILPQKRREAIEEYDKEMSGTPCAQAITKLRTELRKFHKNKPRKDTPLQWIESLEKLWTHIDVARTACPQEFNV